MVSGDAADPGIYEGAKGLESGAATIAEGADGIAGAAAQVKDGIDQIPGQLTAAVTSASAGLDAASGQLTAIVGDENLTDEQRTAIQTALAYISGVNSGLAGATVDLTQADAALDAIAGGAAAISSAVSTVASTMVKGTSSILAIVRASRVLPVPVEPTMMMFDFSISTPLSSAGCCKRL